MTGPAATAGTGRGPVRGRRRRTSVLLLAAVGLGLALALPAPAAAAEEPPLREPREVLDAALECPAQFEATDREPVLLVHGTGVVARENFGWNLEPQLRADGFDVCTVDLPTRALADIQVAAEYVVHGVRVVHAATGRPVDVAGHSQGGLEPRWALAWWPSTRDRVDDVVTIASPHDGTVVADVACAAGRCWPAVHQMRPGSRFLTALWRQEDLAGTDVTSLGSRTDELVQPPSTIELPGAANVMLQDVCPGRPVTHVSIVADAVAYALVVDAFTAAGAADPGRLPDGVCRRTLIDEVAAHHLLDPDAVDDYVGGSLLDPEIPRSLLTREEPELADYAADDATRDDGERRDPPERDPPDADGGGDEAPGEGGEQRGDARPTGAVGPGRGGGSPGTTGAQQAARVRPARAGDGEALPATGGGLVGLGAGLLAMLVAWRSPVRR